jgi:hypothetical protein
MCPITMSSRTSTHDDPPPYTPTPAPAPAPQYTAAPFDGALGSQSATQSQTLGFTSDIPYTREFRCSRPPPGFEPQQSPSTQQTYNQSSGPSSKWKQLKAENEERKAKRVYVTPEEAARISRRTNAGYAWNEVRAEEAARRERQWEDARAKAGMDHGFIVI